MMDETVSTEEKPAAVGNPEEIEVEPARRQLVADWEKRLKAAYQHWDEKGVYKRMRTCQRIAKDGSSEKIWVDNDNYVVPILMRHINQAVGGLYAKNPTVAAKRRQRMLFKVWDGKKSSLDAALAGFQAGDASFIPLLMDIVAGQQYIQMVDRIAKTAEIASAYYLSEQEYDYKTQLKALVRRTKVNGVGYRELGFQRQTGNTDETQGKIADCRKQMAEIERLLGVASSGEMTEESPEYAKLQSMLADLEAEQNKIYREGPVITFPRSTTVVPSPDCQHLKSFLGASFAARFVDMTTDEIQRTFKKDVGKSYTEFNEKKDGEKDCGKARIWYVQDKIARQFFTICEGYPDFIEEPAAPKIKVERFYTIQPLVFNEAEDDDNIFPNSDVWSGRHAQDEINRSRQGLRDHRTANIPWYATRKGALSDTDRVKLGTHAPHEVIEFTGMGPGDKIGDIVQRGEAVAIDAAQYDTEPLMADVLRTVGSQEANIGPTSGATATETSIAENSRMSSQSDNVDDLDDFLSALARDMLQVMLAEVSPETMVEICGPGAVWPDLPATREELQKDLLMEIEQGSSGRPNKTAEMADLERATPILLQLPGLNPEPIAKKFTKLLDLDAEETYIEGLPSITALNAMMSKPAAQPGTGDPATDPAQQGAAGQNNAPAAQSGPPGAQPAFPAPAAGNAPAIGVA